MVTGLLAYLVTMTMSLTERGKRKRALADQTQRRYLLGPKLGNTCDPVLAGPGQPGNLVHDICCLFPQKQVCNQPRDDSSSHA